MNDKPLPSSEESEQSVLGGLLLSNKSWHSVAEILDEKDFFSAQNALIFSGLATLLNAGRPADFCTLTEHFRNSGQLDDAGGMHYIAALAADTPFAANIVAYAQIVRERALLRRLIRIGAEISSAGYSPDGRETSELVEQAESAITGIRDLTERKTEGPKSFSDLAELADNAIDRAVSRGGRIEKSYGLKDLDSKTNGMSAGELIILAARPSMGKSALAQGIGEHCAEHTGLPTLFFSMEMSGESLVLRSYSRRSRVDLKHLIAGTLDDAEFQRLSSAGRAIRDCNMHVEEASSLTPNELRARTKRFAARNGLGLVIIDYMQLMSVSGYKENRTNEMSVISRSLKSLAMEMKVPVIALSQLNRSLETRENKRPRMSDLRESGAIEQDADAILFVYRDEYHNPDSAEKGVAEIIIAKKRNGETGTVRAAFHGQFTAFENIAQGAYL